MTRPQPTGKQTVKLASDGVRISRIRRDPPPVVKEKVVDIKEREQWDVTIGVLAFALSIFVIVLAFGGYTGRTPTQYTVELNYAE